MVEPSCLKTKRYLPPTRTSASHDVASAIHRGIVTEAEAGTEVMVLLASHLAFLRDREER